MIFKYSESKIYDWTENNERKECETRPNTLNEKLKIWYRQVSDEVEHSIIKEERKKGILWKHTENMICG